MEPVSAVASLATVAALANIAGKRLGTKTKNVEVYSTYASLLKDLSKEIVDSNRPLPESAVTSIQACFGTLAAIDKIVEEKHDRGSDRSFLKGMKHSVDSIKAEPHMELFIDQARALIEILSLWVAHLCMSPSDQKS